MTQFRSSPEAEAETSETDYGFEHVDGTFGQDYSHLDLIGGDLGSENFDDIGTSTQPDFLQSASTASADPRRVGSKRSANVLSLGAAQVPRGPVLSDDNFSQMLHNVFIRNAETLSVVMPWEKGVAKTIFAKGRNNPTFPKQQLEGWVQTADHLLEDTAASGPKMVEAPNTGFV